VWCGGRFLIRGQIINSERAKQIRDYSGLRIGNITPTDIDGSEDFHNEKWVHFELKLKGNSLPIGQRLALKRLVDDLGKVKPSIGFIAEHEEYDTEKPIDAGNAMVTEYRYRNQWRIPLRPLSLAEAINLFLGTRKNPLNGDSEV
jgi:hypothetical protein